jgi:anti-sigma factor RsiW
MSRMQCDRAHELLSPYLDGELSPHEQRQMATHVEGCSVCAARAAELERIGRTLADHGRQQAPAALAARVRSALSLPAAEGGGAPIRGRAMLIARPLRALANQAALLAAVCVLSVLATWWVLTGSSLRQRLEQDVVSAHVRSLLQDSPIQVASSDSHTVKPWFAGRVDYSPNVKDLSGDGFALVGGRLDYIDGRRVGALVYKRRLHTINVFMWPKGSDEDAAPPSLVKRKGFNLLSWTSGGLVYWAISDLNPAELGPLQALF